MPALDGSAMIFIQQSKSYKRGIPLRQPADCANGCPQEPAQVRRAVDGLRGHELTFADLLGAVVTAINKDETLKANINAAIKRVSM